MGRINYKAITFRHASNAADNIITAAYEVALQTIKGDKGTPSTPVIYKQASSIVVTITYRQNL